MLSGPHCTLHRVFKCLLATAMLGAGATCFAQAGAVLATTGDNHLDRNRQIVTPLQAGTAIHSGDTIVTAAAGRLQARMADGAMLSMQPGTRFRIDEHRYSRNKKRSFFSLLRGAIRMASGLIGKRDPDEFRLTTPSATIGIRGTHFVVQHTVCDPQCAPGKRAGTLVKVTDGQIVVQNDAGSIVLGKYQSALIKDQISAPEPVDWAPQLAPRALPVPGNGQAVGQGSSGSANQSEPAHDSPDHGSDQALSTEPPDLFAPGPSGAIELSAPDIADIRRRASDGTFRDLLARSPDNASDGGGEEPDASDTPNDAPANDPLPDDPSPTVPEVPTTGQPDGPRAGQTDASRWLVSLQPLPGLAQGALVSADSNLLTFDNDVGLQSIGRCDGGLCLSRGSAQLAEADFDEHAAWGRWTNGNMEVVVFGLRSPIALDQNQGLHYMTGVPVVSLPSAGAFTYVLSGATAPTISTGWYSPGTFSGQASVQFAAGQATRVGLNGQVNIAGDQFSFRTNGGSANPQDSMLTLDDNHRFSGAVTASGGAASVPWMCGHSGCPTQLRGALFGANGERLGLSYSIHSESGSTTIDGVGIFSRP